MRFLTENLSTIVISAVLLAALAGIVINLIRRKKQGSTCGCDCASCGGCAAHADAQKKV